MQRDSARDRPTNLLMQPEHHTHRPPLIGQRWPKVKRVPHWFFSMSGSHCFSASTRHFIPRKKGAGFSTDGGEQTVADDPSPYLWIRQLSVITAILNLLEAPGNSFDDLPPVTVGNAGARRRAANSRSEDGASGAGIGCPPGPLSGIWCGFEICVGRFVVGGVDVYPDASHILGSAA